MARASIETLLPLDTFAEILGISPWEFNQFKFPVAKSAQCNDVVYQHTWQHDHFSREEVAQAIADAEQMMADALHFWPAPIYIRADEVKYPRASWSPQPQPAWLKPVTLTWGHFISPGVMARAALPDIISITPVDLDNDTIFESFECTVAVPAGTDSNEIRVYFAEGDRVGDGELETWRIRPLKITVSDTTATITGHRTLLGKPALAEMVQSKALSFADADNFVTELACYRVYTDSTYTEDSPNQGVGIWNTVAGCRTPDCSTTSRPICLVVNNPKKSIVSTSFSRGCPAHDPERLEVNYLAGLALENGQMQPEMARAITYLAVSMLANEQCGCERSNRIIAQWRARITSFEDEVNKAVGFSKDFNNIPFPITRGGLFAWKRVLRWRNARSVAGIRA